jgi:TRAP transporter TAXI family solute receptor
MFTTKLSPRQWRWAAIGVIAAIGLVLWLVSRFISPAPPTTITFTAGAADGAYYQFATRYKDFLAQSGVKLEVSSSIGSVENLERLKARKADVGLVQSGLGFFTTDPGVSYTQSSLRSLATVTFEPVWIFSKQTLNNGLAQLVGKKIAVGAEGSGTRKVAIELLKDYGVTETNAILVAAGGLTAAGQLISGEVDAAILISASQAPAIAQLMRANDIKLAALDHTEGLSRRYPYLQQVTLKRGAIDPKLNLPAADMPMLSTTANLVVQRDLHPALNFLLLEGAVQVHRAPSLFNRADDFPSDKGVDFPLAPEADRYFRSGQPFLQRVLPFWAAGAVERLLWVLIPLALIAAAIFRILPQFSGARELNRLNQHYGTLLAIETGLRTRVQTKAEYEDARKTLQGLEEDLVNTKFPVQVSERVFAFRQHLDAVRARVEERLRAR